MRGIEGRLVPEIFRWAIERWHSLAEAWEEFFLWENIPQSIEDTPEFDTIFIPWFVFSFVPDPERPGARKDLPEFPAAALYLKENILRLSKDEGEFLLAGCVSQFTFHVVREVTPGRDILLRDILTGEEHRVLEQSASTMVSRDVILFSRVVTVDGASIMISCAPLLIPPAWHTTILDLREHIAKRRMAKDGDLLQWQEEIRALYLHIADSIRNPKPPVLQNTDGEPLDLLTLHFELRTGVEAAFDKLAPLSLHGRDELLETAERDADGAVRCVEVPWMKRGNRKHKEWENTILGHLKIEPGQITAEVNSRQRAERLKREVGKRLRDDAAFVRSEEHPIDELWDRAREGGEPPAAGGLAPDIDTPEAREMLEQMMAKRWEAWLDEKIPVLGNKTPRQAAKTARGRERLDALLADYAWRSTDDSLPHERPDIPALRRKLGI